jgi:hypothetical protein
VARKRPTASDVQQVLADYGAGKTEDLVSAGAAPGPDASMSPAQMRALRRSARLTSAECMAHRERTAPADETNRKPDTLR